MSGNGGRTAPVPWPGPVNIRIGGEAEPFGTLIGAPPLPHARLLFLLENANGSPLRDDDAAVTATQHRGVDMVSVLLLLASTRRLNSAAAGLEVSAHVTVVRQWDGLRESLCACMSER